MDWNKLQATLYNIEPTDPREDRERLVGKSEQSSPVVTESEHMLESTVDHSLDVDREYSVNDLAALAGVKLDESKKHGDYARGSDKMPKAKAGRTKHPLKGKLVGEDEADVDEGVKDAFKAGQKNYNKIGALTKGAQAMGKGSEKKSSARKSTQNNSSNKKSKSTADATIKPYEKQIKSILANPAKKRKFEEFLRKHNSPQQQNESIRHSSKETISEYLYQRLRNQK